MCNKKLKDFYIIIHTHKGGTIVLLLCASELRIIHLILCATLTIIARNNYIRKISNIPHISDII